MTKQEAYEYVTGDEQDDDTTAKAFIAVYGREPTDDDGDIYGLICAGLAAEGYDIHE